MSGSIRPVRQGVREADREGEAEGGWKERDRVKGMPQARADIQDFVDREYEHGFVSDVEAEIVPPGLSEDVIRLISEKKNEPEFLLQ